MAKPFPKRIQQHTMHLNPFEARSVDAASKNVTKLDKFIYDAID
jgi:hypothetical protein